MDTHVVHFPFFSSCKSISLKLFYISSYPSFFVLFLFGGQLYSIPCLPVGILWFHALHLDFWCICTLILMNEIKYGSRFNLFQGATQLSHLLKCWFLALGVWAVLLRLWGSPGVYSGLSSLFHSSTYPRAVTRGFYGGVTQSFNTGGGLLIVAFLLLCF